METTSDLVAGEDHGQVSARASTYLGLFLLALSTLAFELVLTRIFSVTVWYHFAFLAVSLAMFGMTFGALIVDFFPTIFTREQAHKQMSLAALGFAVTSVMAMLLHMSIPIMLEPSFLFSAVGIFAVFANCAGLALPFVFSGIGVCLALTRFPKQIGTLYGCDLIGAALACLFVVYELGQTTGPATVLAAAVIGTISALCFSLESEPKQGSRLKAIALSALLLMGMLYISDVIMPRFGLEPPFRLMWIKGKAAPKATFEKWNSFSLIRVIGDPQHPYSPVGWGLDPRRVGPDSAGQLYLDIDGNAATYITNFNGDVRPVDYLKFDVTNIVHQLRQNANVLVLGVGGGRDVLSAIVFGQKSITGVEINPNIFEALTNVFGNFSGHLEQHPGVKLINDEARSYVTRTNEHFDVIQISLIDTWAATASGAFALAENSLYTTDAWKIFIDHLTDHGILTVSRWYYTDSAAEIVRLVSLAAAALEADGISDPRKHIVLIGYHPRHSNVPNSFGLGTILVCRSPLTAEELGRINSAAAKLNFTVMLSPDSSISPELVAVCNKESRAELNSHSAVRVDAPSDDSPYFMQLAKVSSLLNPRVWTVMAADPDRMQGMAVIGGLTAVLSLLLVACIFVPLATRGPKYKPSSQVNAFAAFFLSIGFGFMFIEMSQMQRLSVFLGHPTYGLSVVMFSILIFSGLGALLSAQVKSKAAWNSPFARLCVITAILAIVGAITLPIMHSLESAGLTTRIAVSIGLLAPIGLCLGIAFPTGMTLAARDQWAMTPWFWALNGIASVLGSVLALLASISFNISFTYVIACGLYVLAAFCLRFASAHSKGSVEV